MDGMLGIGREMNVIAGDWEGHYRVNERINNLSDR